MSGPRRPSSLSIARFCISRGWCVFPIQRGAKAPPLIPDNLNCASLDMETVARWAAIYPGCNWGVSPRKSGLVVLDVDVRDDKRGDRTLDDLTLEYGNLPATFTVRSPSGGSHFYFKSDRHRIALGKHGFGSGLDVPNYVLAPGCTITVGGTGMYQAVKDVSVAPAPDWFDLFIKQKERTSRATGEPMVDLDTPNNIAVATHYIVNGAPPSIMGRGGEKVLFDTAAILKDFGISERMAVELLAKHYNVPGKCEPLWNVGQGADADRLDVKVRNAYAYATENAPGSGTAEAQFAGDPVSPEEMVAMVANWKRRDQDQRQKKLRRKLERQQEKRKRVKSKRSVMRNGVRIPVVER